jgi:DNA transformation protein and related proteins
VAIKKAVKKAVRKTVKKLVRKPSKKRAAPRKKAAASASKMALGVSDGFRAYVLDQLADLGEVTPRSMFGGIGLYRGDVFFGLIARDVLYLKVDDRTRPEYEAAGMTGFQPYPDREKMSTNYYEVPLAVLESAGTLTQWARRAVDVAKRAGASAGRRSARGR